MNIITYDPILVLDDGRLLVYDHGKIAILNDDGNFTLVVDLTIGEKVDSNFPRIRILRRLLRKGVRSAIQIDENTILIFINNKFFEVNLSDGSISKGWTPNDCRALKLTRIIGIPGFNDGIIFGGYLSNPDRKPVSIYQRKGKDQWAEVFSFKRGEINHIHALVPDKYRQCVWILTGDWENAAAIWKAENNFKKVTPILSGDQIYRSCVAFPLAEGLLYATDTPFQQNSIRMLSEVDDRWMSKEICKIPGSCIYGCRFNNGYVFSTTVEPEGKSGGLKELLSTKRGSGIVDNWSHIFYGTPFTGFKEIYKAKKDWLPMGLFQFGTLQFPAGQTNSNRLYVRHIATATHEGKSIVIEPQFNI